MCSSDLLFAPAKTAPSIINQLNAAVRTYLARPEVTENLEKQGLEVTASTPTEMAEIIKNHMSKLGKMIKDAEFLDAAQKARLEIDTMDYKELADTIKAITTTPRAAVQLAKKFIGN